MHSLCISLNLGEMRENFLSARIEDILNTEGCRIPLCFVGGLGVFFVFKLNCSVKYVFYKKKRLNLGIFFKSVFIQLLGLLVFFFLIFAVFNLLSHEIILNKINLSFITKFKRKTRKSPKGKIRLYAENNIS